MVAWAGIHGFPQSLDTFVCANWVNKREFKRGSGQVIRILIADDHMIVRLGLRLLVEAHSGWQVVAEAESGKDAIEKALETKPDVAILDYSLPYMNGIEATKQILQATSKNRDPVVHHARQRVPAQ